MLCCLTFLFVHENHCAITDLKLDLTPNARHDYFESKWHNNGHSSSRKILAQHVLCFGLISSTLQCLLTSGFHHLLSDSTTCIKLARFLCCVSNASSKRFTVMVSASSSTYDTSVFEKLMTCDGGSSCRKKCDQLGCIKRRARYAPLQWHLYTRRKHFLTYEKTSH